MKKALSLILAALLCISLIACGNAAKDNKAEKPADTSDTTDNTASDTKPENEPDAQSDTESDTQSETESDAQTTNDDAPAGYPNDDVDHYARKKYTLCYAMPAETAMHDQFYNAFLRLQDKFNVEIVNSNANNDTEAYLQNIEIMASKKVDGFFIDCPNAVCVRCKELLEELKIPYVAFNSPLYDDNRQFNAPGVIQDGYSAGAEGAKWFIENYKNYWGDVDPKEVKMVTLTSSSYAEFALRSQGASDVFKEAFPDSEVQEIDMTGKGVDAAGAYDMLTPVITTQPDVKYWYIATALDPWGSGCTRAVEGAGMEDTCIVTSIGGGDLISAWDTGYDGCWGTSTTYALVDMCAPATAGLIALIDGRATPDTLWQERIISGDSHGEKYGVWYVESEPLYKDTYKTYEDAAAEKYGIK